jgi:hypothetical protein
MDKSSKTPKVKTTAQLIALSRDSSHLNGLMSIAVLGVMDVRRNF